jgi:G:T-mismatch repair DNA endonuclease (very short patch repair protein)
MQISNKKVIYIPAKGQLSGYFINCEYCGKEVYQTKTQYNKAKHHFCSNKCQKEFEHKERYEDRECEICGELFHVSKKSNQRFCSIECQGKWQSTQKGILNPRSKRLEIECEYCRNRFYEKLYKTKNKQHHFCSDKCRQSWYAEVFSQDENWKEKSKRRAIRILENRQVDTNTKPQQIINDLLENMNISYVNERGFKYYAVDNYLTKYNLIIEVMGDFWHCHPLKYTTENMRDIQKKRIPKDKAKHAYLKNNYNIEVLYLWEDDIYNNLNTCQLLIDKYINNKGLLDNYHSFNYHLENDNLILNDNIVVPHQDMVNA